MTRYFIHGHTFAAPITGVDFSAYYEGTSAAEVLERVAAKYAQIGLYWAMAYASADDYCLSHTPIARWKSNRLMAIQNAAGDRHTYTLRGLGDTAFELEGEHYEVTDPKGGRITDNQEAEV